MKKVYSEPDIFFESFTLNTNIAAGCEFQVNTQTQEDRCGARKGHSIIFNETVASNCTSEIVEGKNEFDNLCYHNPTDAMNLFTS